MLFVDKAFNHCREHRGYENIKNWNQKTEKEMDVNYYSSVVLSTNSKYSTSSSQ